ncbi:FliI/YscN family ATPase [Legionella israelensis]|uniref:protein-secreting ATPase n=2 Tax=Legionella israelensis TaxID=454 RepID=A0A0W0W3P1_9GAMM|nr:FliI/YscN family ATPase [Legionella israelensis]KTD26830.1 nucleotide binding protein FliI [Legionella israelensis]QBS10871.1 FliI/YscN family ATPase [Legionella israelensis]SCY47341.1 flagellum-specific ATP synthase [Legionella israelensis DSM 19235]STX57855.1 nucleotide binding protein FliI [Legionella israelensis]
MSDVCTSLQSVERLGTIEQVNGLHYVASGPPQVFIGELCEITNHQHQPLMTAEVTGFNHGKVYLMPHSHRPVCMGYPVRAIGKALQIKVSSALLGRIVNAFCQPIDHQGLIKSGESVAIHRPPMSPLHRLPVSEQVKTGIHAIDSLMPVGRGQRIGIFAGSGVGKSSLLTMMIQHMQNDINVITFIGERGREVNDFIYHHLSVEETAKKTIVVAACSDESAIIRRQAVYTATAIAEYFCQKGKNVGLFVDSMTRFAMAQREIGLSLGEPPTARGYTPSCFSSLPGLIERAGHFQDQGSITGIYTVLVEGDDLNEPVADNMRALLDGHIVLSRQLAQQGCYPAISITESVSRLQNQLFNQEETKIAQDIFSIFSLYQQHLELIELGAWQKGQNSRLDYAIERIEALKSIIHQGNSLPLPHTDLWKKLMEIIS